MHAQLITIYSSWIRRRIRSGDVKQFKEQSYILFASDTDIIRSEIFEEPYMPRCEFAYM